MSGRRSVGGERGVAARKALARARRALPWYHDVGVRERMREHARAPQGLLHAARSYERDAARLRRMGFADDAREYLAAAAALRLAAASLSTTGRHDNDEGGGES